MRLISPSFIDMFFFYTSILYQFEQNEGVLSTQLGSSGEIGLLILFITTSQFCWATWKAGSLRNLNISGILHFLLLAVLSLVVAATIQWISVWYLFSVLASLLVLPWSVFRCKWSLPVTSGRCLGTLSVPRKLNATRYFLFHFGALLLIFMLRSPRIFYVLLW